MKKQTNQKAEEEVEFEIVGPDEAREKEIKSSLRKRSPKTVRRDILITQDKMSVFKLNLRKVQDTINSLRKKERDLKAKIKKLEKLTAAIEDI